MRRFLSGAALLACALGGSVMCARAQEAEPASTPAPEASPTLMDRVYDGRTHIEVAPYIWGPTVRGNFEYSIPRLPRRGAGGVSQLSVKVAPANYVASLNSAAMFAFDVRKGPADVFGDFIYTNASASASGSAVIGTRGGRIQIPVTLTTNSHLSLAIWEAAAGYTVARGHDADLSIFAGMREFPLNVTLDYNATVGKRGRIAPSGSIASNDIAQDVIFGLRGKAFFGSGHVFVPYYVDLGTGIGQVPNQTWQGYSGAGYAFNHGQTLLFVFRALGYSGFTPISHVQKLTMSGPLLGYTFNL